MREHIYITGVMASGKTTIARGIKTQLEEQGKKVRILSDKYHTNFEGFEGIIIWDDIEPPKNIPYKHIHITEA
jgi:uridine kinase